MCNAFAWHPHPLEPALLSLGPPVKHGQQREKNSGLEHPAFPLASASAGRMQDNEPLMRALSNLINLNQPDLVLFVGEALVGNDAGERALCCAVLCCGGGAGGQGRG